MSKIIDMLEKLQQAQSRSDAAYEPQGQNISSSPSGGGKGPSFFDQKDSKKAKRIFSLAMGLVVILFTMIFVVGHMGFRTIESYRIANVLMSKNNEIYQKKIGELEAVMSRLEDQETYLKNNLNEMLDELRVSFQKGSSQVDEVLIEHNMLQAALEDQKITDRLLLNKFISLNEKIKVIEEKLKN